MNAIQTAIERSGGPTKVASALQVSVQAVCFWRDGKRRMPTEHIAELERLSGGSVRRWEMRPDDWHLIWPELAGTPGAPELPANGGWQAPAGSSPTAEAA